MPCPWQVEHLKEQLEAFGFRKPSGRKEELAQKLVLLLVWLCRPRAARFNDAPLPPVSGSRRTADDMGCRCRCRCR